MQFKELNPVPEAACDIYEKLQALDPPQRDQVIEILFEASSPAPASAVSVRNRNYAIKALRTMFNLGLREAKEIAERGGYQLTLQEVGLIADLVGEARAYMRTNGIEEQPPAPSFNGEVA